MSDYKEWETTMSTEFSEMMDGIRSDEMPNDSLERSLQAAEAIMTSAALKRGWLNASLGILIIYPVAGLIAFGISKYFNASMLVALIGVSIAVFAIAFLFMVGFMVFGRALAGKVLLDCGPFPDRKNAVVMAMLMFAGAIGTVVMSTEVFAIWIAIFLVAFALYWLLVSRGRLQICENGIFQYWSLLPWHKIRSYRWEGDTDATLMLQTKTPLPFMGRGALPVAVEQKEEVDQLLQQHLS